MFSMIDSSLHVIMMNDFYLHMYFIDKTFNRPFSARRHVMYYMKMIPCASVVGYKVWGLEAVEH